MMSTLGQKAGHQSAGQRNRMTDGYPPADGRYVQSPNGPMKQPPSAPLLENAYSTSHPGSIKSEAHRPNQNQQLHYQSRQNYPSSEQAYRQNERSPGPKKPVGPQLEQGKNSQIGGFSLLLHSIGLGSIFDPLRREIDLIERIREQEQAALTNSYLAQQSLEDQLEIAKARVVKLENYIENNEAIYTDAKTAMVSSLSKSVSRTFTDDMINDELKRFYQSGFLSWCADMSSSSEIPEPEKVIEKLQSEGIINNSKDYLSESISLQFSLDLPDGRSSMILLQAILSQTLCETFLQDAYFLVEGIDISEIPGHDSADSRRRLKELEDFFYEVDKGVGVDWRIQTVESLEKVVPLSPHLVENKAKQFIENYKFLLEEVDDQALEDLIQLFINFGSITLKLWKIRTAISIYGMSELSKEKFEANSPFIEADIVGPRDSEKQLQGRNIGVIIRPLIISEPLRQEDGDASEVIWLKAVGWVSESEGSADVPMQDGIAEEVIA